ncbi:hypothetical protein [Halomonas sp. HL-93]|uniref:hypothetical protein n=1 Tax=Halomonas sp. HL-93 TaxID=1666906 RepID=UPI0007F0616C|nr:hypothetical protein [Halomonas sp. HL-93]SBR48331.1 hypothetical protein GA0071314_1642 [Halomonas sp. HL-93]
MEKFYDQSIGQDFQSRLEGLKKKLRSQPFEVDSSSYGIAGNTFRAYRGYNLRPSVVYRQWASLKTKDLVSNSDPSIENQAEFDAWHQDLFESISEYWLAEQRQKMSFAHTSKLLDLYIKWLVTNQECPQRLATAILRYGYCALDSQILFRLNQCLSGALPIKNPTMGDILNKNTYLFCQELIKGFAEKFGGTRILFDYYAWEPGGFLRTRS